MSIIAEPSYVKERSAPVPGQEHYLHLSDLLEAIRRAVASDESRRILDFGCGGSPYRGLFRACGDYKRADFETSPGVDYVISAEGAIGAPSEGFDLILSTQVLEHVYNVPGYLEQCRRLLRPGGQVLLTTHGIFEDHASPHDFRRWTSEGLKRDIEAAGFAVTTEQKLTTNGRAVAFLLRHKIDSLCASRLSWFGWLFRALRWFLVRFHPAFHVWCDKVFRGNRVVDAAEQGHILYVGLLVVARKK